MFNILFPMYALGNYGNDPEYLNLTKEEKDNLDFIDSCIYSEDERINKASFNVMMLVLEISSDPDKYEPEEISNKLSTIYEDLSEEEISTMGKFMLACINSMGVYSEDAKEERKLRKERKNK